jgi:hypothetical protein
MLCPKLNDKPVYVIYWFMFIKFQQDVIVQ